jgi:hypothetical protein
MPNFEWSMLIPFAPLHWTTIVHYLILAGTLFVLVASQSNVSIFYIFFLAALAICTGADLYSNVIPGMPRFVILCFALGWWEFHLSSRELRQSKIFAWSQ